MASEYNTRHQEKERRGKVVSQAKSLFTFKIKQLEKSQLDNEHSSLITFAIDIVHIGPALSI